ncbi:MAG: NAD-glutamate dehydrogenase, partial [Chlamydiia bacterium]|nr:NAD-glutamate dehydrogenase [Chlamydiia bacterium]
LHFTEVAPHEKPLLAPEKKKELLSLLEARHPDWPQEKSLALVETMDLWFLCKLPIERQILALEMFEKAQFQDQCQYEVQVEEEWETLNISSVHIVLAWKNVPKHHFLYRLARVIHRHRLVMHGATATYLNPYRIDSILMLSFGIQGIQGEAAWEATDMADFLQEISSLKYFGFQDAINEAFVHSGLIRGNLGNFLRTSLNFIHQVLVYVDPNLYSLSNIEEALCRHPELTLKLCEAFECRFHPKYQNQLQFEILKEHFLELVAQIDTGQEAHDLRRKEVLTQGMHFIAYTLKTNFYLPNKTALAFRLDPTYLNAAPFQRETLFPELPYGIFFINGMHFIAFHIRFKDLSRGGLRTVYPKHKEQVLAERNTVFAECYNLAFTQHNKNKDIPEGGSKAIIFLEAYAYLHTESDILARELAAAAHAPEVIAEKTALFRSEQELEYLYQTQRAFIQNLLSLINCTPEGTLHIAEIVDYWKRPEYLYLGPDENMHDSMIEWIAQESLRVQYRPGGAFISGKPKRGINHK